MNLKDLQMVACCDKMRKQEQKICEYANLYRAKCIAIDQNLKELKRLQESNVYPPPFMPLDKRIKHFTAEIAQVSRVDPLYLDEDPNVLMKPFYFYGGYVALSAADSAGFWENDCNSFHKNNIYHLQESNAHLKSEVDALLSENYRQAR